jgi:hypothetical protein
MATAKKRKTKKRAAPRKAVKRNSSRLIKSIITDKQIGAVKKSVAKLAKDVHALEKELQDGGTINMPSVRKMVESAVQLERNIQEQVGRSEK